MGNCCEKNEKNYGNELAVLLGEKNQRVGEVISKINDFTSVSDAEEFLFTIIEGECDIDYLIHVDEIFKDQFSVHASKEMKKISLEGKKLNSNTECKIQEEEGFGLIHIAAKRGNINMLQALINLGANINLKSEGLENKESPIFCCMNKCQHWSHEENEKECKYLDCFLLLLKQDDLEINNADFKDWTPLMFITMHHGFKELEDESTNSFVARKLNITWESLQLSEIYEAIEQKNDSRLKDLLKNLRNIQKIDTIFQIMYQGLTLTQVACSFGLLKSTKWLFEQSDEELSLHSQINAQITPVSKKSPIHLACRHAQFEILKFLLERKEEKQKSENGKTLIHLVIESLMDSDPKETYKCLKKILKHDDIQKQINDVDDDGKTALHCAAIMKNGDCIIELLQSGAYIDKEDEWEHTPLEYIEPVTLERFLNEMISTPDPKNNIRHKESKRSNESDRHESISGQNGKSKNKKINGAKNEADITENRYGTINCKKESETKEILFNFEHLLRKSPTSHSYTFNINLLSRIRQQDDMKNLIAHPMLSLIIYFKWLSVRGFYFAFLIFYAQFCIAYIGYTLIPNNSTIRNDTNKSASILMSKLVKSKWIINMTCPTNYILLRKVTFFFLNLHFGYLLIFEIVKFTYRLPKRPFNWNNIVSFCSFEKYLKHSNKMHLISIIASSAGLYCIIKEYTCKHFYYHEEIIAVSILINGIRLFFLLGQHPNFTYYGARFKSVLKKVFNFVIYHFILVFSFSVCFYHLFRNSPGDNNFENIGKSTFRTIIMLTAEYDADKIPFNKTPIISHLIFVVFILVSTIVLLELLTHTLTSAVRKIEEKPILFKNLAQLDVIIHFEPYDLDRVNFLHDFLVPYHFILIRLKKYVTESKDSESVTNEINDVTIVFKKDTILNKFVFERNSNDEEYEVIKKPARVHRKKKRNPVAKFFSQLYSETEIDINVIIDAGKIAMKKQEQKNKMDPMDDVRERLNEISNNINNIITRMYTLEEKFEKMSPTKKSESIKNF